MVGYEVVDGLGSRGVVVRIIRPKGDEDDGMVFVWQSERHYCNADNCNYYSFKSWRDHLRVVGKFSRGQ